MFKKIIFTCLLICLPLVSCFSFADAPVPLGATIDTKTIFLTASPTKPHYYTFDIPGDRFIDGKVVQVSANIYHTPAYGKVGIVSVLVNNLVYGHGSPYSPMSQYVPGFQGIYLYNSQSFKVKPIIHITLITERTIRPDLGNLMVRFTITEFDPPKKPTT